MTYLDLLIRVKQGVQPEFVEFDGDIYKWNGLNYKCGVDYISDSLDEIEFGTKDYIKALKYEDEENEPETKTLGDIIAEKCF